MSGCNLKLVDFLSDPIGLTYSGTHRGNRKQGHSLSGLHAS